MQIKIPLLTISERTTLGGMTDVFEDAVFFLEQQTGSVSPLLLFEPVKESRIPSQKSSVSEAPEELLVVALDETISQAVFQALKRVEAREPSYPTEQKRKSFKLKENTPLKSVFRQMAEMPLTVFSISSPVEAEAASIFFLRTAFTVSVFRHEIELPIE